MDCVLFKELFQHQYQSVWERISRLYPFLKQSHVKLCSTSFVSTTTLVFFGTWPYCKVLLWYHVHLWLLHDLFFPLADNTSLEDHLHFFTSHSLTSFLLTLIFGTPMQTVFNQVMSAFYFNIFGVPFPLFNYLSGSHCGQFYLPFSFSGDELQCLKTFLVVKTGGVCCK